jgi:hypothetical protein
MKAKRTAMILLGSILLFGPCVAIADDEHHPDPAPPQQPGAQQQSPISGMGMPGMMPMPGQFPARQQGMGGMAEQGPIPMGAMMNERFSMMGMSAMGEFTKDFPGAVMMQRVEGRIAFLRTELKIDDSQQAAWAQFTQALRDNAKTLSETHAKAIKRQTSASGRLPLNERLAVQEEWFASRAAGINELRNALDDLYAVLSDAQKENAEELLAPHLGMGSGIAPIIGMMSVQGMGMPNRSTSGNH